MLHRLARLSLLSEAPTDTDVADSLHALRNPSLPRVKTFKSKHFVQLGEHHLRRPFDRSVAAHPVDELVLICGESGVGGAVMQHLRGVRRCRILYASLVPGSERAQRR